MDQKFSLLKKPGCRYATLLIVFMGRYAAARTLLSPIQFLNIGLYSIQSVTISGPLHAIPDGLETPVWDQLRWDQADYALSKLLCYLHSNPGSVS
jgi:hypothetical protein